MLAERGVGHGRCSSAPSGPSKGRALLLSVGRYAQTRSLSHGLLEKTNTCAVRRSAAWVLLGAGVRSDVRTQAHRASRSLGDRTFRRLGQAGCERRFDAAGETRVLKPKHPTGRTILALLSFARVRRRPPRSRKRLDREVDSGIPSRRLPWTLLDDHGASSRCQRAVRVGTRLKVAGFGQSDARSSLAATCRTASPATKRIEQRGTPTRHGLRSGPCV